MISPDREPVRKIRGRRICRYTRPAIATARCPEKPAFNFSGQIISRQTIVPIRHMPIISTVVLFCFVKF